MKKKLVVLTKYDENGASSRYRILMFRDELDKQFDTRYYCFWSKRFVTKYLFNKRKYILLIVFQYIVSAVKRWFQLNFIVPKADILFIQKDLIPKCNRLFLKRALRSNVRIIFDQDDAMYTLHGDISDDIARVSDAIICGNESLAEHYYKLNKNITILPTVEDYRKYEPFIRDTFNNKIIGWIGTKTTINNLEMIVEPINNFIKRHPEVQFLIISNTALDYTEKIINCRFIKWDRNKYIEDLSNISVGIMPLFDNAGNRGKCGFKLIQYLTLEKPVIGSDVGVNGKIIEGNGIVVNSETGWENALENLLYNSDRYHTCVSNIESNFMKKYNYYVVLDKLLSVLDG